MDTSNILENVPIRKLLESSDEVERRLGTELEKEMAKTLDVVIKRIKPLLPYIASPVFTPADNRRATGDKPPRASFRGVRLIVGAVGDPFLFLDEKGKWMGGTLRNRVWILVDRSRTTHERGFNLGLLDGKTYAECFDVEYEATAWQRCPFNQVLAALKTAFEKAVEKREKNLASMKDALGFLGKVKLTLGIGD